MTQPPAPSRAPASAAAPGAELPVTERTTLKRHAERGSHERATVHAILDEALVCHVAVVVDGAPRVLPLAHTRIGDGLYVHGARTNRLLGAVAGGAPACVTATLLDGLVFGRTWFRHSMNYRCAVVHGSASAVTDPGERLAALAALIDKAAPGRSNEARPPTPTELGATLVVRFPIEEASAKVRSGPPLDGPDDGSDDCWSGELPLGRTAGPWRSHPDLPPGVAASAAVAQQGRRLSASTWPPYERTRGDFVVSTDPLRIDFEFVHRFLAQESYWARGVDEAHQAIAMAHSLSFGLYRGREPVGFARVLTDFGRIGYLADVFVEQAFRGQGLGSWLVAAVLEHPGLAKVPRWLLGTADAHGLYERFGFVRAEPGRYMVRVRER